MQTDLRVRESAKLLRRLKISKQAILGISRSLKQAALFFASPRFANSTADQAHSRPGLKKEVFVLEAPAKCARNSKLLTGR